MLFGLLNNTTLEVLDISGHQGGDAVATGIGKVLQHNATLHTLYLDGNTIGIAGLTALRLGLQRNKAVKCMPLPLADMSVLLKESEENAPKVFQLARDIQKKIYENAVGPATSPVLAEAEAAALSDEFKTPRVAATTTAATAPATPTTATTAPSTPPPSATKSGSTPNKTTKPAPGRKRRRTPYDENRYQPLPLSLPMSCDLIEHLGLPHSLVVT